MNVAQSVGHADLAAQYGILVARDLFVALDRRYARLFEDLRVDEESCRRDVRIMWRLPTFEELGISGMSRDSLAGEISLIVPLTIMRRGQMYSDFQVGGDVPVRILSHNSSSRMTIALIRLEWDRVIGVLSPVLSQDVIATLEAHAGHLIPKIVESDPRGARDATTRLVGAVEDAISNSGVTFDGQRLAEVQRLLVNCAQRLGRRHIIWGEVCATPGGVVSIEYGYETRFALGYSSARISQGRMRRVYDWWKRWVGQPPSLWILPISRHALAQSYHVTLQAPADCFLDRFSFIDRRVKERREASFDDAVQKADARINGRDEAGGSLGHLHILNMRQRNDISPAVLGHIMERQPGATASVAWLATMTLIASVLVATRWRHLFEGGDVSTSTSVALALPGAAALWFSHVLDAHARRRLTTAARVGLYGALYATAATLALVLLTSLGVDVGRPRIHYLFWAAVIAPLTISVLYAWRQRIRFQRRMHAHQRRVAMKYGL